MRGKRKDEESSERQGGSVWWNWCAHMYKDCSRPFQGHGTWFLVFYFKRIRKLEPILYFSTDLESMGKNLSRSVIIAQVPKSISDNVILIITGYSQTSFIGTLIYRDLHLSGSRNLIYRDILFLLQPPLLVHSDIVCRCFICRSFIMSIFLHTFVLYIPSLPLLNVNIQQESWQPTMRL